MRLGIAGRDAAVLALGVLLGWAGSRAVIPVPRLVHLSPTVSCGGHHEVSVPMAENITWAVQSGARWWDDRRRAWVLAPPWHAGRGKVVVGPSAEGVRLVVRQPQGFTSGQLAGATIRGVK